MEAQEVPVGIIPVSAFKWVRTSALAAIGGGIAGSVSALMDPQKYQFPRDFGSGKMWTYFLTEKWV